jgi:hypothetical protein
MEFDNPQPPETVNPVAACARCGTSDIDKLSPTPLCFGCREALIKFPIPIWIKAVAVAILVLLIISLAGLPKNISLAIHLERGKKAEKEKKYVTAQREFSKVLKAVPAHLEAKTHLCLATYFNMDYSNFVKLVSELDGKVIEDREMVAALEDAIKQLEHYFPNDSLQTLTKQYPDSSGGIPDHAYTNYIKTHEDDLYARYQYASQLFDRKDYKACDSIVSSITAVKKDYVPAIMLLTSLKRLEGDLKSSLFYCDQLLNINRESTYGYSTKARTLLKMKQDKQALDLALKTNALDENDGYNLATLALAYHFNNQHDKRDRVIQQVKQGNDSLQMYYLQSALDIISNKEKFRN